MAILDELRDIGSGGALFKRVLGLFASRAPGAIDLMAEAARTGDRAALADAVHGLKSICASIGARRAMAACQALEHAARSGAAFDAGALLADINREIHTALAEVERLRAA